jgi:hypothetical protein
MNTSQFLHFSSKANQLRALNLRSRVWTFNRCPPHTVRYFMEIASVDILITVHQLDTCKPFFASKKAVFFQCDIIV